MAAAASLQPAAPPHHDLHHRHDRPRFWTLFLLHSAMAWTTSSMLRWLRLRQLDLLLLLFFMILIIVMIGHDSGLSSSFIQRWRGQHPACRGGFGGGSGVTPTCCSSLHDLHQRHDRPRLWPFFLMHPALTRTTSDTLMWLRWRQLNLLVLLFFMIFIIVMVGHDSGFSSSCIRR